MADSVSGYPCCLNCGLKALNLKEVGAHFINYAKLNFLSITDIIEMNTFYIKSVLRRMDESTRTAVLDLCKMLIHLHGKEEAPLFHSGYFFKKNFTITDGSDQTVFGQVACGQVLEILHDETSGQLVKSIVDHMTAECVNYPRVNQVSSRLSKFVFNKAIHISPHKNELWVYHDWDYFEKITLRYSQGCSDQLFIELFKYLEKIPGVNLIVVELVKFTALVRDWIRFFESIYGGLDLNATLFVIPQHQLQEFGNQSVDALKRSINFDADLDADIEWLNLTAFDPNHPNQTEYVDPLLVSDED